MIRRSGSGHANLVTPRGALRTLTATGAPRGIRRSLTASTTGSLAFMRTKAWKPRSNWVGFSRVAPQSGLLRHGDSPKSITTDDTFHRGREAQRPAGRATEIKAPQGQCRALPRSVCREPRRCHGPPKARFRFLRPRGTSLVKSYKPFKDLLAIFRRVARAVVSDIGSGRVACCRSGDPHGVRGVPKRVIEEVPDDLTDPTTIGVHESGLHIPRVDRSERRTTRDDRLMDVGKIQPSAVKMEC